MLWRNIELFWIIQFSYSYWIYSHVKWMICNVTFIYIFFKQNSSNRAGYLTSNCVMIMHEPLSMLLSFIKLFKEGGYYIWVGVYLAAIRHVFLACISPSLNLCNLKFKVHSVRFPLSIKVILFLHDQKKTKGHMWCDQTK